MHPPVPQTAPAPQTASSLLAEVELAEAALRAAMLASDVPALDRLLADELIFTDQAGRLLGKAEDLATHRSGLLRLARVQESQRVVRLAGEAAIVTLRADLGGRWDGMPFNGAFRYTRVWRREPTGWRVVAAHCSALG